MSSFYSSVLRDFQIISLLSIISFIYVCNSQCIEKCYYVDETLTAGGAHTCINHCDCWSIRNCSKHGWCQGYDTYYDPPSCDTTKAPTPLPTTYTSSPTPSPTKIPTEAPTENPTPSPTSDPTPSPTSIPTPSPTTDPTPSPTTDPTAAPTSNPTPAPTNNPTLTPTANPAATPTSNPTYAPTNNPTLTPTANPTATPTSNPTHAPTNNPTPSPTSNPTASPTIIKEQNIKETLTIGLDNDNEHQVQETTSVDIDINDRNNEAKESGMSVESNSFYLLSIIAAAAMLLLCIIIISIFYWKRKHKQINNKMNTENMQNNISSTHDIEMQSISSNSPPFQPSSASNSHFKTFPIIQTVPTVVMGMNGVNNSNGNELPAFHVSTETDEVDDLYGIGLHSNVTVGGITNNGASRDKNEEKIQLEENNTVGLQVDTNDMDDDSGEELEEMYTEYDRENNPNNYKMYGNDEKITPQ